MKQVNPIKFHWARLVRLTRNAVVIGLLSVIAIGFLTTSSLAAGFDTTTIGPKSNLQGAILDGVNLSQKDVNTSYLGGASLVGANLSGANLSGSIFQRANLSKANLSGADLRGTIWSSFDQGDATSLMFYETLARLGIKPDSKVMPDGFALLMLGAYAETYVPKIEYYSEMESYTCGYPDVQCLRMAQRSREVSFPDTAVATLTDADFSNADLRGACLQHADLNGVKLLGTIYDAKTLWPKDFDPSKVGAILK